MQYLYLYYDHTAEITQIPPTVQQLEDADTPDMIRILRGEFSNIEEIECGEWLKVEA